MRLGPLLLVAPRPGGPPTGGSLYDERLTDALVRAGVRVERLGVSDARRALSSGRSGTFLVDSLYLDPFSELARDDARARPLGLLAHYLPSLVDRGDAWEPSDLRPAERSALSFADLLVVPSEWMASVLLRAGARPERLVVVVPGVDRAGPSPSRRRPLGAGLSAVMVANAAPAKGLAPFLRALSRELEGASAAFELSIVGDLTRDPAYAEECRALVRGSRALVRCVGFRASLPHRETLDVVSASDALVSASRMESYGMALAEARALGVPILSLRGGNAASHVDPRAGGALFEDDAALARALIQLSHDPSELQTRRARAERSLFRRTWDDAVRDFVRGMGTG